MTKKSSWARWPAQATSVTAASGCGPGSVQDQHIDGAEAVSDRGSQPGNPVLVGDIGAEALGRAAIVTDRAADGSDLFIAGPAIDRDGETATRQPPRDHRPSPRELPVTKRRAHASQPCGDDPTPLSAPGQHGNATKGLRYGNPAPLSLD